MAERRPCEAAARDVRIRIWLLSGETVIFHASAQDRVRSLRVTVAEHFICCVGQVRLFLEDPALGQRHLSDLACRVAEHLGCSQEGIPQAAGDSTRITLPLKDGLSLHDYGFRKGRSSIGRMRVVISDSDAIGHVLNP